MSLIVKTSNRKDEKFLAELLSKLGYKSKSVDIDELEDLSFGYIMKKNDEKDLLTFEEAKTQYSKMKKRNK